MKIKQIILRDAVKVDGVKAVGGLMAGPRDFFNSDDCEISHEGGPWIKIQAGGKDPTLVPLANVKWCSPVSDDDASQPAPQKQGGAKR